MFSRATNRNAEAKIGPLYRFRRQTTHTFERSDANKATNVLVTVLGCTLGYTRHATGFDLFVRKWREYNLTRLTQQALPSDPSV